MKYKLLIGCDISKSFIDFAVFDKKQNKSQFFKIKNDLKQIKSWVLKLTKVYSVGIGQMLFCLEHSGVYGYLLIDLLVSLKIDVGVENAYQIKHSLGLQRGKNDKTDAERIAEYAFRFEDKIKLYKPKKTNILILEQLRASRLRFIKAKNLLEVPLNENKKFVKKEAYQISKKINAKPIRELTRAIEAVNKEIANIIKSDSQLTKLYNRITTVPGVGIVLATELLIKTNAFEKFASAKQLACYAGVAPFDHISGSSIRGKSRISHKACKSLKTLLHMAALSVINSKTYLANYYKRKVAEGKNKMSVLNALRNKIVHLIFAVVKNQTDYQKGFTNHMS